MAKSNFKLQISSLRLRKITPLFFATARTAPHLRSNRGYSLVEVLVAISVLMIALIGPLTIASSGLQRAFNSREQTTAIFLAQEALEGVMELRETSELQNPGGAGLGSFGCTSSSPCGVRILDDGADIFPCTSRTCDLYLVQEGGQPKFQHDNSGEATGFRREVVIEYASDDSYSRVISTVTWGTDADQEVSMDTYIYDIYEG